MQVVLGDTQPEYDQHKIIGLGIIKVGKKKQRKKKKRLLLCINILWKNNYPTGDIVGNGPNMISLLYAVI